MIIYINYINFKIYFRYLLYNFKNKRYYNVINNFFEKIKK